MKSIQVQDLGRVQQIASVLARNGFGHVLHVVGIGGKLPAADPEQETKPYARRLRQALVDLGPTFVKFGQVLSVRPDILPEDVLKEFQSLQDRVPPLPFDEVKKVVEQELGQPMDEVFDEFEPTPLGSASIAQVHRARLAGGVEVAVKLQRPGIAKTIRSDIAILYSLAQVTEGRIAIPGMYTPTAIIHEFDVAITKELDFLQEMRCAERMARNFEGHPDVMIPKVFERWCTRKMLVMELVDGKPLKRVLQEATGDEAHRIAHKVMDATYRQVFEHGFFHGDPHPGNLFLLDDGRIAYLDFGVTGMLTSTMQDTIIQAFTSLVFRDAEAFAMTVYRAGATSERIDLRAFRDDCEKMMVKYHGASLEDITNPTTLTEVVQLASEYRINLPPEFAVLSRAIGLIEGIVRGLLPSIDIVAEVGPYAQKLMRQRFSPERMTTDVARLVFQAQGAMRDVPTQMSQVFMDLEAGRLTFNIRQLEAERHSEEMRLLRDELRMGGLRVSLALLASTVTLGSLLFLAVWSPAPFGIPLFGLLGFLLLGVGAGLFGALGLHVFFARFLDLRAWRRRFWRVLRFFSWRRDRS